MGTISSNLVDIWKKEIYPAEISFDKGKIVKIERLAAQNGQVFSNYIIPGFVDAHVHIESSMLVPAEFARLAVVHGTVATVSDPHEIANVCGIEGVNFMIENGKKVPFKFNFGAPSCVPATVFETAGDALNAAQVESLLKKDDIRYLSEMMNFPGVLNKDPEVMKKITAAHNLGKPVDGHAPGLRDETAKKYIDAGISTDHECFTAAEALDKLGFGMKILIREGSAAKNFDALIELLNDYPEMIMFCSDDKHPDSLAEGHINQLCARAIAKGISLFNVLQAACVNPVLHYNLNVGLLREGDPADFIVLKDLVLFETLKTFINGTLVAENGNTLIERSRVSQTEIVNNFSCNKKVPADFEIKWKGEKTIPVIEALDGQLITHKLQLPPNVYKQCIISDPEKDVLKIIVVNRYYEAPVAKAFIKNFGLQLGAIASSVAHDSHNIVAVGVDDESICQAVNLLIEHKGGVSCVTEDTESILPLPVAGLMSMDDGYIVAKQYSEIDRAAKELGSTLLSPFMTLSFMALLVIPHLKLSDKGLFDGDAFQLIA